MNFNLKYLFLFLVIVVSCNKKSSDGSGPLFELVSPETSGVKFENKLQEYSDEHIFNFNYLYNGAGVALGDINNDGLVDIYFSANRAKDKLYLNKGNFKFEDISDKSGISEFSGWRNGVVMEDVNSDGFLDIYVCRGGFKNEPTKNANLLFINNGDLTFTELGSRYGVADIGFSIASCFFDYDNDNDLDLYVTNRPEKFYLNIEAVMEGKKAGSILSRDNLYRNNGDNTFTMVTDEAGITNNFAYGLSVTAADLDQDGDQDLYVANDFVENDYYYENQGNGTFKEKIKEITGHVPYYAMGTDIGDINNDGWEDIFTVEMRPEDYKRSKTSMPVMSLTLFDTMDLNGIHRQYMHNCLQLNHGNGHFSEIAQLAGVDRTDWSWAALMMDLDNDGFRDLYVANGIKRDLYNRDAYSSLMYDLKNNNSNKTTEEIMRNLPSFKAVNYAFKNNGDLSFKKNMKEWGMDHTSKSHGAAFADLDNDGFLDLVVSNMDDPAFIYRNKGNQSHYLRVKCKGPDKNPRGIGAKIKIDYAQQHQYTEIRTARGYLSCSEDVAHFGLGDQKKVDKLTVIWPDGKTQELNNIKADKQIVVSYSDAQQPAPQAQDSKSGFFVNQDQMIVPPFVHKENAFDDYHAQILLPHRLSRIGPKISTGDVNKDGLEDFFVGGAKGQSGALYIQQATGGFALSSQPALDSDKGYEDLGSLFFDADGDSDLDLYVVSGGSESPEGAAYQDRLYINDGKGKLQKSSLIPKTVSSGSVVSAIDFDDDGDLDLFRGGRLIPDKYPFAPKSYLFENQGKGKFVDVTEIKAPALKDIGMVCAALWIDLDQDKNPELILAGEWMGIQVLKWNAGVLEKQNPETYGLTNTEGWWNSLTAADLDGDGDLDVIGGNLGLNYKFHASNEKPFEIYCSDFDDNGTYDIVLAKYNGDIKVPVRGKQCSQEQMPFIEKKFPSYNAFADAKLEDIYGEGLGKGIQLKAKLFESVLLTNDGGKFKISKLPAMAQFSTVQASLCTDVNKDGRPEIIVSGNFLNAEVETTRADAGVGCVMVQENNTWRALSVRESGLFLPYDVKDMKMIKGSGVNYLLVSSNNEALRLYTFNN